MLISYSTIASILSLIFTAGSALVFALPLIRSDDEIQKISGTSFGENRYSPLPINPHMKRALILERKMAYLGLFLLSVGVLFQILSIFI